MLLGLAGVPTQSPLDHQFLQADLGRTMGTDQAGVGGNRKMLPGFGQLHFLVENGSDQHRIHLLARTFLKQGRPDLLEQSQGLAAQWPELTNALKKELGQGRLGAVHSEMPLQDRQFLRGEVGGLALGNCGQGLTAGRCLKDLMMLAVRAVAAALQQCRQQTQRCGDEAENDQHRPRLWPQPAFGRCCGNAGSPWRTALWIPIGACHRTTAARNTLTFHKL